MSGYSHLTGAEDIEANLLYYKCSNCCSLKYCMQGKLNCNWHYLKNLEDTKRDRDIILDELKSG